MSDDKNIRHRFTVPTADVKVNEWIESQSNLGFSLRVLIKAFIREYGIQDATCLELGVQVKKKGRPPKSAQIKYNSLEGAGQSDENMPDELDDVDEEQTVHEQMQSPPVQAQEPVAKPVTRIIQNQTESQRPSNGDAADYEQVDMNKLGL